MQRRVLGAVAIMGPHLKRAPALLSEILRGFANFMYWLGGFVCIWVAQEARAYFLS